MFGCADRGMRRKRCNGRCGMTRSRLSRAGARRKIGWQHNEAVSLVPKLMLIHRSKNSVFGAWHGARLGIIKYPLGSARQH